MKRGCEYSKKILFPAKKNAQALNLDVFEKGKGMSLPRLGHRPKTRRHPADKKDAVLAPVLGAVAFKIPYLSRINQKSG